MKPSGRVSVYSMALALALGSFVFLSCGKLNFDPDPNQVGATPTPGPFSPSSISGLVFWLRADQGVALNGAGNVTSWQDSVGSVSLTPPVGGPAWNPGFQAASANMNGQPSVSFSFDTSNRYLEASGVSGAFWCGGAYTVLTIGRPNMQAKTGSNIHVMRWMMSGQDFYRDTLSYFSTSPIGHSHTSISIEAGSSTWISYNRGSSNPRLPVAPGIWGLEQSGVVAKAFDNGIYDNAVSSPNLTFNACGPFDIQLGMGMGNTPPPGNATLELAEVMVFSRAIGAVELNKIGCYAKNRYGISGYSGTCN